MVDKYPEYTVDSKNKCVGFLLYWLCQINAKRGKIFPSFSGSVEFNAYDGVTLA